MSDLPVSDLHFVISAPRSGSTWLTTALNHHPEIFATEHRLFGNFCEVWKNNDGTSAPRITFDSYAQAFAMHYFFSFMGMNRAEFIDEFQVAFAEFMTDFAKQRTGKRVVVDKITPYPGTAAFVVSQIKELFPAATIIQLIRDGRDVLTSGTFDWLLKDAEGTDRYEYFVNQRPGFQLRRFFDDEVVKKWANNWKETIVPFANSSGQLLISYELMKADLPSELMKVFAAVGAEASSEEARAAAALTTFESMTGRRAGEAKPTAKARKGIIGDWKNYFTRTDGELFDSIAGQELVAMGYAADRDWWKQLPEELTLKFGQN